MAETVGALMGGQKGQKNEWAETWFMNVYTSDRLR